jgi:hypothetical protein
LDRCFYGLGRLKELGVLYLSLPNPQAALPVHPDRYACLSELVSVCEYRASRLLLFHPSSARCLAAIEKSQYLSYFVQVLWCAEQCHVSFPSMVGAML